MINGPQAPACLHSRGGPTLTGSAGQMVRRLPDRAVVALRATPGQRRALKMADVVRERLVLRSQTGGPFRLSLLCSQGVIPGFCSRG